MEKKAIDFRINQPVKTKFGMYNPYSFELKPNQPEISLPLKGKITTQGIGLNPVQKEVLKKYGFIIAKGANKSFLDMYDKDSTIPFFLTTDVFMHTFHCFIDKLIKRIESEYLSNKIVNFLNFVLGKLEESYNSVSTDVMKKAIRDNIAHISVQLRLLDDAIKIPSFIKKMVAVEIRNIHSNSTKYSEILGYKEDFSQYKPRGHYTESELLKKYFKAMMYAGRMSIRFEPVKPIEICRHQIRRIFSLISIFDQLLRDEFEEINRIISFFFGVSDDITLTEAVDIWIETGSHKGDDLANDIIIDGYLKKFAASKSPKINTVLGFREDVEGTKGFSLFGQKFTVDSYMFQELVYDKVDNRYSPKGLDIFSVYGSKRAQEHLINEEQKYPGYISQISGLKEFVNKLTEKEWTKSLYSQWIYTLLALHIPINEEFPYFMQSKAWQDKCLLTSLGSWTELRYDAILYAKQPTMIMLGGGRPRIIPEGYVEPNPEFFARLYSMTEYLKDWIQELELETMRNSYELYEAAPDRQLQSFLDHIDEMIKITIKEIQGEPLSIQDYSRIRSTGFLLEMVGSERNPAIAADVYTDPYHGKVLEEAIGHPKSIYVAVPNHEGELRLTRGAIYSHYEFLVEMNSRLTKEEWGKMLRRNPPDTHDWIKYLMAHHSLIAEKQEKPKKRIKVDWED